MRNELKNRSHGLRYYMHDGPNAFRFELAGELNGEDARRLDQDWRTASSVIGGRRLTVDITFVTAADREGSALLAQWHRDGARIAANSEASRRLAESILGEPVGEGAENVHALAGSDGTWLPVHWSVLVPALLLLGALLFPVAAEAATLKSDTVTAWDDYIRSASASFQERVHGDGPFLWTFEDAGRAAKVRSGEIVVAPAAGQNPKKVPAGLIHHWMGAMFLAGVKLDDVLDITGDYDRYKDFYHPSVIESKEIAHNGPDDRFSMLLINQAFFSRTALDADYQATNVRIDDRRCYRVSKTTRVQEIEDFGQADEHKAREGEGGGYIWKLYSIARFEQRDGGVYVELEAMALSRDIPGAVRLVADPIVRRVSRNALVLSMRQTEEAVRGVITLAQTRQAGRKVPAALSSSAFFHIH